MLMLVLLLCSSLVMCKMLVNAMYYFQQQQQKKNRLHNFILTTSFEVTKTRIQSYFLLVSKEKSHFERKNSQVENQL